MRAGRHDRPEVRAARRDRHRRAVLHRRRQLRAVRARTARARACYLRPRALTLWAFIGLESATVPAEEVKDPERTIPRATMHRHGHHDARSTSSPRSRSWASSRPPSSPPRRARSPTPPAQIFGGGWDKVIALVALVSTFGALNGWILLQGRVPLAAAEDGLFPAAFAKRARQAPDAGVRPRRLVGAGDRR